MKLMGKTRAPISTPGTKKCRSDHLGLTLTIQIGLATMLSSSKGNTIIGVRYYEAMNLVRTVLIS